MPSVPHQAGASPGEQGKDRQVNEVARVAIVTGGGTGIGAATALELGRQGVAVALVGRRRESSSAPARSGEGHMAIRRHG
jgi:NADP-dependent 3-hydroxy acid dehydrogenase YdfG